MDILEHRRWMYRRLDADKGTSDGRRLLLDGKGRAIHGRGQPTINSPLLLFISQPHSHQFLLSNGAHFLQMKKNHSLPL
ncbi:hypothetical protein CR513_56909, partial [Mucuna pruriens]